MGSACHRYDSASDGSNGVRGAIA